MFLRVALRRVCGSLHAYCKCKPVIIGDLRIRLPTAAGRTVYSADLRTGIAGIK